MNWIENDMEYLDKNPNWGETRFENNWIASGRRMLWWLIRTCLQCADLIRNRCVKQQLNAWAYRKPNLVRNNWKRTSYLRPLLIGLFSGCLLRAVLLLTNVNVIRFFFLYSSEGGLVGTSSGYTISNWNLNLFSKLKKRRWYLIYFFFFK